MNTIYKTLVSAIVISFIAGCASMTPVVRSPGKNTLPAWMCDGSPVDFTDTERLMADYEGLVDEFVAIGDLSVPSRAGGYDGEAEWAIMFAEPLINFKGMPKEDTEVVIYGMIEGKDLQDLSNPCESGWKPSSLGNNVLTSGQGIKTTLAKLKTLSHDNLLLTVSVLREDCHCEELIHSSCIGDLDLEGKDPKLGLRGEMLNSIVDKVAMKLQESNNPVASKVRLLNLAVAGDNAAAVKDPDNLARGKIWAVVSYPFDFLQCLGLRLKHAGRAHVASQASQSWKAAHAGDTIVLRLQEKSKTDSDQYDTVGTARLKLTQN